MKIYNCINRSVKLFDKEDLELDYEDWILKDGVDFNDCNILFPDFSLTPKIEETSYDDNFVQNVKYQHLPLPPEGYDYYIVTSEQLLTYVKQGADTSKMVLLGEHVIDDFFEIVGYCTLNLINYE